MRRFLWFALLLGLFLKSAMAPPAAAAAASGPRAARPSHHPQTLHHIPGRGLVKRGSRHATRLTPARVETKALIDPVPLKRFPFPPPLRGSHDSLLRQNLRSQQDGLQRIQDDDDILSLRRSGALVPVPVTSALLVDGRLPANRRYCRPWTALFLSDLSQVHYRRFHRALQVNSAVRTVEYQRHLELVNGNAAPAEGVDASPHLSGATIDIAKKGLSFDEVGWMRAYLAPLQAAGKIDVEEEFYQSCFHITVYRSVGAKGRLVDTNGKLRPLHAAGAALLAAQVE